MTYYLHHPKSGGKAGKGRNKTSTVQVRKDNMIVKQFRYSLAMPIHKTYAITRAEEFIKQQMKGSK